MDSDEEFMQFAEAGEAPPSPVPQRKLKRLRRKLASPKGSQEAVHHLSEEDDEPSPSVRPVRSPILFETLDSEERDDDDGFQATKSRSVFDFMRPKEGAEMDYTADGSGTSGRVAGVKRSLDFGSDGEEPDGGGDGDRTTVSVGVDEEICESRMEESEKQRAALDGTEVEKEKTKKKHKKKKKDRGSDDGCDEEPSAGGKKDRRTRLKELRVESQRLLRETRDASFKPQPLVQKPVSTILEKIRQRRLELSKRSVRANPASFDENDLSPKGLSVDLDSADAHFEDVEYPDVTISDAVKSMKKPADMAEKTDVEGQEGSKNSASPSSKSPAPEIALSEELKQTFRAPLDDTQDLFDSQTSDSKDEMLDETPRSPLEEVLAPSLLAMNLKFDSVCPLDSGSSSDEEEYNDKENIDPRLSGSIDLSLSPKGDPMKAFIDEEAEEEDDSDNDLNRFQENEDDDDDDLDSEEINDIIATGFKEKPVDDEMRNELHQKWLEQQDAAGTEHLMKKLNCGGGRGGSELKESLLLDEGEEDEESNWEGGDFLDEAAEGPVTRNVIKMNLKKAKEMMPLMFTDHNDVYVSSDDEETERSLVQQRMFVNPETRSPFVAPAEDESSKDIFSRIKKLNPVPDSKKKPKITSHFQSLSIGGNKATKSKSSFLQRGSRNPQQSFQMQGSSSSSISRSFIFERDDSHSRNTVSSDDPSESVHVEPKARRATAKFMNSSQARSSANTQSTQAGSQANVGAPSLHEILKASRQRTNQGDDAASCHHVESTIYTAFKLDRNLVARSAAGSVSVRMV
ncbi:unnamed protein product [Linum trigynum]|uniref:Uncharacterized protein n=1 Tax=Linum trigynum TaxID=586398 RepID=A0AAV2EFA9_9ROSI